MRSRVENPAYGWGQPHLSDNVLPRFAPLYPDYRFDAEDERVIKCTRVQR